MSLEQLQEIVNWLKYQIKYLESSINEAQQTNNYGRKLQHEGMRDAFIKCLNQLNKYMRKRNVNKPIENNI